MLTILHPQLPFFKIMIFIYVYFLQIMKTTKKNQPINVVSVTSSRREYIFFSGALVHVYFQ